MLNSMLRRFIQYLINERGLVAGTVNVYASIVRLFIKTRFGNKPIRLKQLQQQDITQFIIDQKQRISCSSLKNRVYALRAFIRFLQVRSKNSVPITLVVPAVAQWRLSKVPKVINPPDIERILASSNTHAPGGSRNHAILLLLARLGLRAGEVITLSLDDIQWGIGELAIRGKGHCTDKLPLLQDVGNALAQYIQHERPRCVSRKVFITFKKPYEELHSSSAIYSVVKKAIQHAGIPAHHISPHVLRHSLAVRMLHKGASLPEISKILRHRSLNSTQIYAKVDLPALRMLVQRWPKGTL